MHIKSKLKKLFIGIISTFIIGCAMTSKDVKSVQGSTVDLVQLSGKWEGEYNSTVTQRIGTISFDLNSTSNQATGRIMLTPKDSTKKSIGAANKMKGIHVKTSSKKPLSIDFVGIEDGKVSGDVTPYTDPAFGSVVFTNFEGVLKGNRMEGIFTSRIGQTGNSYTGTWWAVRK